MRSRDGVRQFMETRWLNHWFVFQRSHGYIERERSLKIIRVAWYSDLSRGCRRRTVRLRAVIGARSSVSAPTPARIRSGASSRHETTDSAVGESRWRVPRRRIPTAYPHARQHALLWIWIGGACDCTVQLAPVYAVAGLMPPAHECAQHQHRRHPHSGRAPARNPQLHIMNCCRSETSPFYLIYAVRQKYNKYYEFNNKFKI